MQDKQRKSKIFSIMVVGDNPDKLMEKYKICNGITPPYIKYHYQDASKMRKNSIKILEEILKDPSVLTLNQYQSEFLTDKLKALKSMSDFEYFMGLVEGLDIDDNGDAWSDENPNGKWETYRIGRNLSLPLILKDEKSSYSCLNKDVNWDAMHMQNVDTYDAVWDLVHHVREVKTETEKTLYENMKDRENYFSNFKNKDEYIIHNCAYWNYAYLDENGWRDISEAENDFQWISQYYERFVLPLNDVDKITIFECSTK